MVTSCKLYTNSQWMKCDMMLSHHLQLDVACDVFNATNWLQLIFGCKLQLQIESFLLMNYNAINKTYLFTKMQHT
jgi:hypothetical protein